MRSLYGSAAVGTTIVQDVGILLTITLMLLIVIVQINHERETGTRAAILRFAKRSRHYLSALSARIKRKR